MGTMSLHQAKNQGVGSIETLGVIGQGHDVARDREGVVEMIPLITIDDQDLKEGRRNVRSPPRPKKRRVIPMVDHLKGRLKSREAASQQPPSQGRAETGQDKAPPPLPPPTTAPPIDPPAQAASLPAAQAASVQGCTNPSCTSPGCTCSSRTCSGNTCSNSTCSGCSSTDTSCFGCKYYGIADTCGQSHDNPTTAAESSISATSASTRCFHHRSN